MRTAMGKPPLGLAAAAVGAVAAVLPAPACPAATALAVASSSKCGKTGKSISGKAARSNSAALVDLPMPGGPRRIVSSSWKHGERPPAPVPPPALAAWQQLPGPAL